MDGSTGPIAFLDPQPQPGDPDRVWFAKSRTSSTLYAVTRTSCSCPWGVHHPDDFLAKPCRHHKHLLELLDEVLVFVGNGDESRYETRPKSSCISPNNDTTDES
jgi:hypothetical protein